MKSEDYIEKTDLFVSMIDIEDEMGLEYFTKRHHFSSSRNYDKSSIFSMRYSNYIFLCIGKYSTMFAIEFFLYSY